MLGLFIPPQGTVTDLLSGDVGQEMSVMHQEREKKYLNLLQLRLCISESEEAIMCLSTVVH